MTITLPDDPADDFLVGWVTVERARSGWADSDTMSNRELAEWLASAYAECEAYAPALAVGVDPSENLRVAQIYQARATWRALSENTQNQMGPDGYQIIVYPLDWTVKQMLRPKRGKPVLR